MADSFNDRDEIEIRIELGSGGDLRGGGVVGDGKTGLIVPPRDPVALGAALARLIADAPLRTKMGEAGRARVEAEFSVEACAAAYAMFYRGIVR